MAAVLASFVAMAVPASAQAQAGMPPSVVSVITVKPEVVPLTRELPGRIAATRIAEVRPRVSGILLERVFRQGGVVKEGEVLYRIDPTLFKVAVASAKAALERAKAAQILAVQQEERQRELQKRNINSVRELDQAVATLAQAKADVAAAEAGLQQAQVNLDYTDVRAPIAGRIGRALVTEGALVNVSGTAPLAIIHQLDPVYADFTQSSGEVRRLREALAAGDLVEVAPNEASVELLFDDGVLYPLKGRLLFSESSVDSTTGQITLRAEFPNPQDALLPGLYVRGRIEQGRLDSAIAVPQQAIVRDPTGGAQVYVVGPDDVAQVRNVTLGAASGERWVVRNGLQAGDRVIVEGFQKVGPGAKVTPAPWKGPVGSQAVAPAAKTPAQGAAPGKTD